MATKNKKNKSLPKKYRLYYYGFWIIFVFGLLGGFGLFYSASTGLLGEMPDFRQLENPNTNLASQIISSDNRVLGKIHFGEMKKPMKIWRLLLSSQLMKIIQMLLAGDY